jgi:uncharacterized protein YegJ (DUF2314 family)
MMENPNNIRPICGDCADKKKAETQRNLPALSEFIGKYVKKRFEGMVEGKLRSEHMWVKITSVNEGAGTLIGMLDNEPVLMDDLVLHDEVIVYRGEIEEIEEE